MRGVLSAVVEAKRLGVRRGVVPAGNGAEAAVVLPRPAKSERVPGADGDTLPPRLRQLLARITARGTYSTQDHMEATGVSHRTGLRDLQLLVRAGLVERVGSRRGAFYRPTRAGRIQPAPVE